MSRSKPSVPQIAESSTKAPLNPQQKRFNTLTRQIKQARETLAAWREGADAYRLAHAEVVPPLDAEWREVRLQWLRAVDALQREKGWTRAQREALSQLACEAAGELLEQEDAGTAVDSELRAMFAHHAGMTYEEDQRLHLEAMKEMAEGISGLDLGAVETLEDEADLMERMHQAMAAQARPEVEADGLTEDHAKPGGRKVRRPTRAQQRREDEARQASQSVRDVFRKLASAIHPDRETDEQQRAAKTAMMQKVNQAYAANDLLALLELQLEIEQIDADHLKEASADRLRHFNKVLAEQLAELKAEIDDARVIWCMEFGVSPFERLVPTRLGAALQADVQQRRAEIAELQTDLRQMADRTSAKRWLRKQQERLRDEDPFDDFGLF